MDVEFRELRNESGASEVAAEQRARVSLTHSSADSGCAAAAELWVRLDMS